MIQFGLKLNFMALAPAAFAQTNAGRITGTIADQQSAVSSHASVPALEAGRYRLTAEMAGFNKLVNGAYPKATTPKSARTPAATARSSSD